MVIQGRAGSTGYSISLRPESLTVSLGGVVVACDRGGRLYSLHSAGRHYRRGLNGRVLEKWQEAGVRQRGWLDGPAADSVVDQAAATFRCAMAVVASADTSNDPRGEIRRELRAALSKAAEFDSRAARRDAQEFARVYRPIGILPPDQYLALVLQATEGCAYDGCTFCDLYGQPFRVKPADEFRAHLRSVHHYLGDSAHLRRRSIFLGAANALAIPMPRLRSLLEVLAAEAGPGVAFTAFLDGRAGRRKTAADFRTLADLGLRRVYVGLESGHDPLLEFVRKPGRARDAVETVRRAHEGGVAAGVIVMVGLGGDRFAEPHVRGTIAALRAMELGEADWLYFSDLVEVADLPYVADACRAGIRPLSLAERVAQRQAIQSNLAFPGRAPRMSSYDIREFVY